MNRPLVSSICITGKDRFHIENLLPVSIECFNSQVYEPRELVIVTDSEIPVKPSGNIRVVQADKGLTLGELRNRGLDAANGEYVHQHDDEYFHPTLLSLQVPVAVANPGHAVFLRSQIGYCWRTDVAFVRTFADLDPYPFPIVGTVLAPNDGKRYPAMRRHEDMAFAQLYPWAVMFNDPCLYVHFCHCTQGTSGHSHVMREAADWEPGTWGLGAGQRAYLETVLQKYPAAMRRRGGG